MVRKYYNKKMKLAGEVDDFYLNILIKRILRGSSPENFANVWPLKKAFVEAGKRQVERFRQARQEGRYLEDYLLTKEDLLGKPPVIEPEKSAAWRELQQLLGLDDVKESILAVVHQVSQNYDREMRGLEPLATSANRVFLGSPGTGKTTVAKLYARILADFGILSKGDVIIKKPSDLIDRYIGGSENNTREALSSAKGGVLIIDDAHMLDPGSTRSGSSKNGDFRGAIIDTIVAEVSGSPGEDRCVIMCAYEEHMKEMYANSNPGLARRFPLDTAFLFKDFDSETLGKILDLKLNKEKLVATEKAREVALDMLDRASVRPGFGNGGEVDNLLGKAIASRTSRISKQLKAALTGERPVDPAEPTSEEKDAVMTRSLGKSHPEDKPRSVVSEKTADNVCSGENVSTGDAVSAKEKASCAQISEGKQDEKEAEPEFDKVPIEPEDFDPNWDRHTRAIANTRALFDGFIGYEEIITKFESYQYMAQGMRLRGIDPRPYIPFTYVFKGPPGTGKTSTARKLGQIFYDMGLLAAPEVVDVSASQLIGEYCGQTAPKVVRLLESALGKVLFIDEAYRLAASGRGSFAEEAVSELVDAVTKPKFARKLIIVLAGYEDDMDRLMRLNPGIKSRFATEFTFKPLRAEQCIEQLRAVVGKVGITIQDTREMDANTRGTLVNSLSRMSNEEGWASGRSVETLGEKIIAHIFKECAIKGYTGKELMVTGKDLLTILAGSGIGQYGSSRYGTGAMGPRQLMTLKDLRGNE
jgi:AAA+ superfamily predicted ATPase